MNLRAVITAAIALSVMCLDTYGQRLRADLQFDGLFDNREFKNDMQPQTIYGMRIMPELGIEHSNGNGTHTLMAGFSKIWEFGAHDSIAPDMILYYQYKGRHWTSYFGSIPRHNLQRQLPDAFLYDSIAFFEPTISGTLIKYSTRLLNTEIYCNWFSRQTEKDREAFRIVWDGYVGDGVIGAGWFTAMTHYAKPKEPGHYIYEKFQLNPYLSLNLHSGPGMWFKADAGVLCSLVRCRKEDKWHNPAGFLGDVQLGWRFFDLKSTLFIGDSQQPFLNDPEAGIAFHRSDPFFNHTFYNKTELGVMFVSDRNVQFGFRWNLHFTPDTPVHNQQLITVRCRLSSMKQFRNKP